MVKKIQTLLVIALLSACQSEGKLTGDSNVYLDVEEGGSQGSEPSVEPDNSTGAADDLVVDSFQATQSDDQAPSPTLDTLSCGVDGHAITIDHQGVLAHCDQSWTDITIDVSEEFHFIIHYGFDPVDEADCAYDLKYTIDLQDSDLPAGVYNIVAHGEETLVDLSYVLGEND